MTYAVPGVAEPRRRPAIVTAAGYLLLLSALLLIISAILPLTSLTKVVDATRQAYANCTNPNPDTVATATRVGIIGGAAFSILLGIGVGVLALLDLRGSRVARIITWVVGGLGVLCLGCGLGSAGLSGSLSNLGRNANSCVDSSTVSDKVKAAEPSWLQPTSTTLSVVSLLALILVIILLALPAANAYFRKAGPQQPGGPEPAYPNLPYPPVPGTPPAGNPPAPGTPPGPGDQPPAPPA